ncbi:hypothetical protein EU528_14030 [Candidatus Thorarchaeota archaeon]|nr:MAG: hypothetical protein EU528_14030 [Candidatus Thorarchaeota archaeon]
METTQSTNETCRIENVGKFAVPICGHDVLTEFMVQDLKTNPNNGILIYGGLYANDSEDRFFWYVSTLRPYSLAKIASMAREGVVVREYFTKIIQGDRIQTLYRAFERPFAATSEDDVEALVDLGIVVQDESGIIRVTAKGIELCNVLAHLTVNHRIKPSPKNLQLIFESFVRTDLWSPEEQMPADRSLTVDVVMKKLEERGELEHLENEGIDLERLQDVIHLYLCPPF